MVKVKLERQYLWSGTFYGPGEVQVPESFVDAYNLKPQGQNKSKPSKGEQDVPPVGQKNGDVEE